MIYVGSVFRRSPALADDRSGLEINYWESHDEELLKAGLPAMLRRLPALVTAALRAYLDPQGHFQHASGEDNR